MASSASRFQAVEKQYAQLKAQYRAGKMSEAAYQAALKKLVFEDDRGQYWMLGADSGQWYRHDGSQWVRADPPLTASAGSSGTSRWPYILGGAGCLAVLMLAAVIAGVWLLRPTLIPPEPTLSPVGDVAAALPPATDAPAPTNTPPPPTSTSRPPSPTPTATRRPTNTPKPPTSTSVPPTNTPQPPTATPLPPTPTPIPPTATPVPLNKIAFVSDRDGNKEIYLMNPDGSGLTRLTNHPAEDDSPAWSPDGRHIAFTSTRSGNQDIWAMNADGSGAFNLTNHPAPEYDPAWSPDGRLAFTASRDDPIRTDIWVINPDGSGAAKLQNFGISPAWSPDGRLIAGIFRFGGLLHLAVIPSGGGEPSPLLQLNMNNFPDWSPNGQRIAFQSAEDSDNSEILVINANGSGLVNLTNHLALDTSPAWSGDSRRLAFSSDRTGNNEIFVMQADGSGVRQITNHPGWDAEPDWSP